MTAYYNEHYPHAAEWLRRLIAAGQIAPGVVDERDIRDVRPDELTGYTQCHFFAGVGGWSYALRKAGWGDERPVWTGSCPCQSFSAAGKGKGFADERHLWPVWFDLIRECRPSVVLGEQVSAAVRHGWLDLVFTNLEGVGYACGALAIPACSVGAPHIRERLFFVGHAERIGAGRIAGASFEAERGPVVRAVRDDAGSSGAIGVVADSESLGLLGRQDDDNGGRRERASGQGRSPRGVENATGAGRRGECLKGRQESWASSMAVGAGGSLQPGPTNGLWRDADWLGCTDGKWRPVESGTFPLVDGASFRMGSGGPFEGKSRAQMLKGYGNAINAEVAAEFIRAYLDYRDLGG